MAAPVSELRRLSCALAAIALVALAGIACGSSDGAAAPGVEGALPMDGGASEAYDAGAHVVDGSAPDAVAADGGKKKEPAIDFTPWTRTIGAATSFYSASAACSDADGNVLVTGSGSGNLPFAKTTDATTYSSKPYVLLAKYDNAGKLAFAKRVGAAYDAAYGIATNAAGAVFVAGSVAPSLDGAGDYDAVLTRFDASGAEVWKRRFGTSGADSARAVAVDASGNAVVVGTVRAALPGQSHGGAGDAFARKVDASGKEIWTKQFAAATDEQALGVAIDAAGNAFVVGWGATEHPGAPNSDYHTVVRKLDPAGTMLWSKTMDLAMGSAIAVDGSGNVVIGGSVVGALPGATSAGLSDAFVAKLDPSGNPIWTKQLGTSGGDYGTGVAVDAAGNVFLGGRVDGALAGQTRQGYSDGFLRKYAATGAEVWTKQFGSSLNDDVTSVFTDVGGNAYAAGTAYDDLPGTPSLGFNDAFVMKFPKP